MRLKLLSYRLPLLMMVILLLLSSSLGVNVSGNLVESASKIIGSQETVMNGIVWSSPARLTWLGNSTNADILRSDDGNYNIVWQDFRNENWDIYYLKVRPDGFKLVNDSRITYYSGNDINPVIGVRENYIYVVWQRYTAGHWAIYFSRLLYNDKNILIEIYPVPIRKIEGDCVNPRIGVDGSGNIHIVWQESNGNGWNIMYEKLSSSGTPLISPVEVSGGSSLAVRPQLVVDENSEVHIFWVEYSITPGYSVFYRKLSSDGNFLTEKRRISVVSPQTTINAYYYNNSVYTVFSCSRERLAYEVIFTRLGENGITEVDDTNLTISDKIDSLYPHLAVIHNRMFVVWNDYPEGVIKFSIYDTYGNIIGDVFNISANNSFLPAISVNHNTIGIVWQKSAENGTYLYFRSARFPDVVVKAIHLQPEGNNITLKAQLYSSALLEFEYGIYLDDKLFNISHAYFKGEEIINKIIEASPGWHKVSIVVDPGNLIIENNESNNEKWAYVFVKYFSFEVYTLPRYDVPAGREYNISFTLKNTGNWIDNYTVRISYNKSAFKISPSFRVISIGAGEERAINLTIFVYKNVPVGNYTINLTVESLSTGEEYLGNITLHILPYVDFKVEYAPVHYVLPGQREDFSFIIRNLGNCNDTYKLTVSQSEAWPLIYGNTTLNASYGGVAYFNLTLLVPNGTYAYTKNFMNITVKSLTLNISLNATVVFVVMPVHALEGYVTNVIKNGTFYRVYFNVINRGNMKDLINIEITGDVKEYAYISNASVILSPGEGAIVWVNVYMPPLITAGSYTLIFNALYQNITLLSIPVSLTVEEIHRYAVMIEKLSEGDVVAFRVEVKNTGNAPEVIDVVPLLVQKYNATWIILYMGENYTNSTTIYVDPNRSAVLVITLHSPLPNGQYSVNVLFSSVSKINKNVTLDFRVGEEEKTIWQRISEFFMANLMYIVIVVVIIAAVSVYFIRFRK